jgi:glycosyltransferase involved in cell wall biosynthesis
MKTVSIIVPVKEEQETIALLTDSIENVFSAALKDKATLREIIFVDDGSTDGTWSVIEQLSKKHHTVVGVKLRRNFGKAAALQQGIKFCTGDYIFTMDGDLQDDPIEIPRFIEMLDQGYDVVSGWKQIRHDPLGKTLPSKLFNWVTARISGVSIHDFNCGFKLYRSEILNSLKLYGELHRFIPVLAHSLGYRVAEISVTHHARRFGKSKYGAKRLLKGFLDLLTVVTITKYGRRPGHLFGGMGAAFGGLGGAMLLYLTVIWLLGHPIGQRPLLVISALFLIVGVQFVLFGMVAELIVNISRDKTDDFIVAKVSKIYER